MVEFAGASKEWTGLVDFINKIAPSEIFKDTSSVCFKQDPVTKCITAYSDEVECIIPTDDTGNITIKITPKTDPDSEEIQVPKLIEITRVRCATWPLIEDQYGYERQQGEDTEDLYFELKKSAKEAWKLALFDAKGREQGKPLDLMQCMKDNLIVQTPPTWWIDCDNAVMWLVQWLACYAVSPRQLIESCDVLTTLVNVSFWTDDDGNLEVCVKYKDENGEFQEECWPLNMSAQTICQYIVDECGATLEVDPDTWIIEFIGNDQVPVLVNICDIVTNHCISVDAGNILNVWSDGKLYVGNPIVKDGIDFSIDPITCIATITCTFSDGSVDTVVAQVPDCDNTVQSIAVVNNNDGTATITYVYEDGTSGTQLILLLLKDCNETNIDLGTFLFQNCRVVVASYTSNYDATTWLLTVTITYTDGTTGTFVHQLDQDNTVQNINVVDNWDGTATLTYTLEDWTPVSILFSLTIEDCLGNLVQLWVPQFIVWSMLAGESTTCREIDYADPDLLQTRVEKNSDWNLVVPQCTSWPLTDVATFTDLEWITETKKWDTIRVTDECAVYEATSCSWDFRLLHWENPCRWIYLWGVLNFNDPANWLTFDTVPFFNSSSGWNNHEAFYDYDDIPNPETFLCKIPAELQAKWYRWVAEIEWRRCLRDVRWGEASEWCKYRINCFMYVNGSLNALNIRPAHYSRTFEEQGKTDYFEDYDNYHITYNINQNATTPVQNRIRYGRLTQFSSWIDDTKRTFHEVTAYATIKACRA